MQPMQTANYFQFDQLKDYVLSVLPQQPAEYMVSADQQQAELNSLKQTIGSGRFFFVIDLERFEIANCYGLQRWLGYSDKDFTTKRYFDTVLHPGKRMSVIMVAKELYSTLCTGVFPLSFMVQRYRSLVALKHYDGYYLLANKISSVFQYDRRNRLTSYLNEFTIIGLYEGQPMQPTFFTSSGGSEENGKKILRKTIEHFIEMNIFSERELQIARKLAYEPGIKELKISSDLNISPHTVDEYGKRFLKKARLFFHHPFAKVSEAALYLKKEGLL